MVGSNLLRFSDREVALFDFETNGLQQMSPDTLPFQCSWLVANRHRVLSTHDYYMRWSKYKMSAGAARVTRFNPAWVENGDDPEFVLDTFESYTLDDRYLLVSHSILGYDSGIWNLWREALGRPRTWSFLTRIVDTHLLSRAWKEGWKPDRSSPEAFLAWQFKVAAGYRKGIKTNLTQMCKDLEVPIDESKTHDATYDLQLNVQVYWKLIQLMEI